MIKVPATRAGIPAIQNLIEDGINVNVTLLFGLGRYEEVAEAYLTGLEARASRGQPIRIASVASFFLSRIDVQVDARLDEREHAGQVRHEVASRLRGQVAIASARAAYQMYKRIFASDRFQALADRGARPQRLLWASTSTKNPAYSDVKYVEALIGEHTINTVPLETFNAYRDHGKPARRLEDDVEEARTVLDELSSAGLNLDEVTQDLEDEGVRKFIEAYDRLLRALAERRAATLRELQAPESAP
jgi:transaldolase